MNELGLRLKKFREYLGLTQDDVAKLLEVSRVTMTNIENGTRKLSAEELFKLSKIYGVSTDEILQGEKKEENVLMFARTFKELDEHDQEEILGLMKFKKMYKDKKLSE